MKFDASEEHINAQKGLEDLLKSHKLENYWDIYEMQGISGLINVLKLLPANIYKEVWGYIKKNKAALRFFGTFPIDI